MVMSSSASRREHTPLLAMYLLRRTLSDWTGASTSLCLDGGVDERLPAKPWLRPVSPPRSFDGREDDRLSAKSSLRSLLPKRCFDGPDDDCLLPKSSLEPLLPKRCLDGPEDDRLSADPSSPPVLPMRFPEKESDLPASNLFLKGRLNRGAVPLRLPSSVGGCLGLSR